MTVEINHAGAAGGTTDATAKPPADPNAPVQVTTAEGRTLTLQRPELLAEFDFIEAIGPQLAANQTWVAMAMQIIFVREIDGVRVTKPRTEREVKALVARLGHDGFNAITKWVAERAEAAQDGADNKDKIKNS